MSSWQGTARSNYARDGAGNSEPLFEGDQSSINGAEN